MKPLTEREAQKEELENSKKILRKSETEQIDGFTTNCHGHDSFLVKNKQILKKSKLFNKIKIKNNKIQI